MRPEATSAHTDAPLLPLDLEGYTLDVRAEPSLGMAIREADITAGGRPLPAHLATNRHRRALPGLV